MAISFEPFDLAQVLRSVPSMVSGQIPMVLKLSKQDWVAHSTSRNEPGLVTWRQTVAFPVKYKKILKLVYFCAKMINDVLLPFGNE